jgi:hypothetical protein
MKYLKLAFHKVHYILAVGGIIHLFAQLDFLGTAKLPFDYTWGEIYLVRIEYLKRRSEGIECSFNDVEREHLEKWWKSFEDAKKRFWEERNKQPNANDWWV